MWSAPGSRCEFQLFSFKVKRHQRRFPILWHYCPGSVGAFLVPQSEIEFDTFIFQKPGPLTLSYELYKESPIAA